jgi:adenine-specific DNA-methyltransferase
LKSVFVGGSRKISHIGADVKQRLDRMIEGGLLVLVGDANGADKAIQTYLHEREYRNVRVFCTGGDCRNNVGQWPAQPVTPPHRARDFAFFTAKDAAMAEEADAALMLWDGESNGTLVNVARMTARRKPVVIYIAPVKSFETIRSRADLERLLAGCPADDRTRIHEYIAQHAHEYAQTAIF